MILYQWRGRVRNFGDELNGLLWPTLLPGFFDADPASMFLGIGSVLDSRHDPGAAKLVAGAGYGGYEAPARLDPSWVIHWVRGPRTARMLGLPAELGIGDPASLLGVIGARPTEDRAGIGFMPHFESVGRGHWDDAARAAGVRLIDPSGDPAQVLTAIGQCQLLISEALHGVIAADALRVPWIAARPIAAAHRPKWFDWAESLDLRLAFRGLVPSSVLELGATMRVAQRGPVRRLLSRHQVATRRLAQARMIDRAAQGLRRLALAAPQLSDDAALDRACSRMQDRIAGILRQPFHGSVDLRKIARRPSLLRVGDEFAYHPVSIG